MIESNHQLEKENPTTHIKLYSIKSIALGSFIGSPLAAGYLISENFKALNEPEKARNTIIVYIIVTICLFTVLFLIPEEILDKIPSFIIPIIYTVIIGVIVEKQQGAILRAHEENGNELYSGWRAAGIGLVTVVIIIVLVIGYFFISEISNSELYDLYDSKIEQFSKNEEESLIYYDYLDYKNDEELVKYIDDSAIPLWEENIVILKELNIKEGLSSELLDQNEILLNYSETRLEIFQLLRKALSENTDVYDQQLIELYGQIDDQLNSLNE